jgi:RNA-directed DNA polymerase
LRLRLGQFGLTLNEVKTRILEFGRYAVARRARRGQRRPETFDFLGFIHICGRRRENRTFIVRRQTVAKRMTATLKAIRASLCGGATRRSDRLAWLKSVVQDYLNHHAVPESVKRLGALPAEVCRAWLHTLRRRSQRSRMTWERMRKFADRYVPKVRALHPYPHRRFAS